MRNTSLYLKLLALAALVATALSTACVMIYVDPKTVECPEPEPIYCLPGEYSGIAIDTSMEIQRMTEQIILIKPVEEINTELDEWRLTFLEKKPGSPQNAVLTFSEEGLQRVMIARLVTYDRARIESGLGAPFDGSVGPVTARGDDAFFSVCEYYRADDEAGYVPLFETPLPGQTDIYSASIRAGILFDSKRLGSVINYDSYSWESHPALSPDKTVLFFASDRPGGFGGVDIWFSILKDGSVSEAINCGPTVNTPCDDMTPYVSHDSKKLFFASSGGETVGGFDLFSCNIDDGLWNLSESGDLETLKSRDFFSFRRNLMPPINTEADELFPTSPADEDSLLYFSSSRPRTHRGAASERGGFDIYVRMKEPNPAFKTEEGKELAKGFIPDIDGEVVLEDPEIEFEIPPTYVTEGTVYNKATSQPLPFADITVKYETTQAERDRLAEETVRLPRAVIGKEDTLETSPLGGRELESTASDDEMIFDSFKMKADSSGKYAVELDKGREYEITAQTEDLFFDSFKVRVEKSDTTTRITRDFQVPENLTLRINFPSDKYDDPYKYTLDSNGVSTSRTWDEEMDLLASNILNSLDKIEKMILVGHTDEVGSEAYNERLGLNRVNFVISELVKRGVPEEVLEGRSAGETDPLPKREGEPLKMFRKRLRRVELQKITKQI